MGGDRLAERHRPSPHLPARQELLDLVGALGLAEVTVTDVSNPEDDPLDPASLAEMNGVIDRYLERAGGDPELIARGEALRRRLGEVGIRGATSVCIVGRKPGWPTGLYAWAE